VCRREFYGYMGFKGFPWENFEIRPTEIEFESNFSHISQHLGSTEYSTFLTTEKFENKTL